ncbi:MAG TPA: hypothetical protein VGK59_21295 [Ohtaekwangia sp.]
MTLNKLSVLNIHCGFNYAYTWNDSRERRHLCGMGILLIMGIKFTVMNSTTTSGVHTFFDDYATALMSYSAEDIARFYQTPLAVYSDNRIRFVNAMEEVVSFWREAVKPYKSMDIEKAMPVILNEEQLSETIFISKVLWNNTDKWGKAAAREVNFYILSQTKDGLKISGLILMK